MFTLTRSQLHQYLSEIIACNALEVHAEDDNLYIPYMMNDALECCLHFSGGQLTGHCLADFEGETSFEFVDDNAGQGDRTGIIFRQGADNVFTLWYTHCCQTLACYRYDQIGHFWVKGEEHWRRLVYIIGTIYDKYEYMGDRVCSPSEIALLPLMEFAPFRMFSPIHESLDSIYNDTERGLKTIEKLAAEANDRSFLQLLSLYRRFPFGVLKKILHRAMNAPGRIDLYQLLFTRVEKASAIYPARSYDDAGNRQIAQARSSLTRELQSQGYTGTYPLFQKENRQILAMEEHPFTILEASDFHFRIQLMESETARTDARINAGFFRKKGNTCKIRSWN